MFNIIDIYSKLSEEQEIKYLLYYIVLYYIIIERTIINFTEFENLSTSEVIAHGELSEQMTQHGLGSGIYGFIDKSNSGQYGNYKYETNIIMNNCVIIDSKYKLGKFIQLSTAINKICFEVYTLLSQNRDAVFDMFIPQITAVIEPIEVTAVMQQLTIEIIIIGIMRFINDYSALMSYSSEGENYIVMPINYLLEGLYDGIYNPQSDNPANGSVAYIYTNPRSYKRAFGRPDGATLKGRLIHNQLLKLNPIVKATLRPKRQIAPIVFKF